MNGLIENIAKLSLFALSGNLLSLESAQRRIWVSNKTFIILSQTFLQSLYPMHQIHPESQISLPLHQCVSVSAF